MSFKLRKDVLPLRVTMGAAKRFCVIGGIFEFREGFCCRERRTEHGSGLLSQAHAFIGVPAQVTDELLAGIANMIGSRSENFQRIPVGDIVAEQRVARRGLASIRYHTVGTIVGKAVQG